MSRTANSRFELRQLTSIEWIIADTTLPETHPHRTVACLYEVDDLEYDVVWLHGPDLRAQYSSPEEALAHLMRATGGTTRRRSERPIPLPHLRPLTPRPQPAAAANDADEPVHAGDLAMA